MQKTTTAVCAAAAVSLGLSCFAPTAAFAETMQKSEADGPRPAVEQSQAPGSSPDARNDPSSAGNEAEGAGSDPGEAPESEDIRPSGFHLRMGDPVEDDATDEHGSGGRSSAPDADESRDYYDDPYVGRRR